MQGRDFHTFTTLEEKKFLRTVRSNRGSYNLQVTSMSSVVEEFFCVQTRQAKQYFITVY